MPLAQAHPFQPIPVTHEEESPEVRESCNRSPGAGASFPAEVHG